MTEQERYMKEAIRQAKKAAAIGEVPIGCVIVYEGKIIARGYNRRKTDKNTLAHAELQAIKRASKRLGDWRLEGCSMYVTLEPCQMCAGALVQARITEVVIGCMNPKAGCAGSILNLLEMPQFNHQVKVTRGVLGEECSTILKDFFKEGNPKNMYELIGIETEKAAEDTGKFEFRPVGLGMQDWQPILDASVEAGAEWVVVEQDESIGRSQLEAVEISRKYLQLLGW